MYGSGILGIVVRAYFLASSRGVEVYSVIADTKTSCVGASANFNATNTAFSSVGLFSRRVKRNIGVGTTKNVSSLSSTREFLRLNTSELKADHIIGLVGTVG